MKRAAPFAIECSPDVMEEIRRAAVAALSPLPHSGAEIGGVLLGKHSADRVQILCARPLLCEYASGPTFNLSIKDQARLTALLHDCGVGSQAQGSEPVGWYHSHTRSEILLSPRDLEIYNKFFPECWQIALVVRPHELEPTRAGFFFRQQDGSIRMEPSLPTAPPPAAYRSRWRFWWPVFLLGVAAVLFALRRDHSAVFAASQPDQACLTVFDAAGQLQIRWDSATQPVRSADSGTLEITDGSAHAVVSLDPQLLREGSVSYARLGSRVDLRLTLRAHGRIVCEHSTKFLGRPAAPPAEDDPATLQPHLQEQAEQIRQLEHDVAGLRWLIRQQQAKRGR